jgi:hypothetical protein
VAHRVSPTAPRQVGTAFEFPDTRRIRISTPRKSSRTTIQHTHTDIRVRTATSAHGRPRPRRRRKRHQQTDVRARGGDASEKKKTAELTKRRVTVRGRYCWRAATAVPSRAARRV